MSRYGLTPLLALTVLAFLVRLASVFAQEITLHGGTSVVLVPTLVTDISGEPVFGLTASDFAIYDNGVEQNPHLDETAHMQQTSVVVAIQKAHTEGETLDKVRRIGSLLYPIVGEGKGEVAVVAFSDQPVLKLDFTGDLDVVTKALSHIGPGNYNNAVLDAIAYSTRLLQARPQTNRKVLFLVSEPADRGSSASVPEVMRMVESRNVLVYGAAYQPGLASKMGNVGQAIADPMSHPVNLLGVFSVLTKSAEENVVQTVAQMSGGEYLPFSDEHKLEAQMAAVNNHYFNHYLLSFTPKKLSLGQHSLRVTVPGRSDVVVSARTGYWVGETPEKETTAAAAASASGSRP